MLALITKCIKLVKRSCPTTIFIKVNYSHNLIFDETWKYFICAVVKMSTCSSIIALREYQFLIISENYIYPVHLTVFIKQQFPDRNMYVNKLDYFLKSLVAGPRNKVIFCLRHFWISSKTLSLDAWFFQKVQRLQRGG